MEPLVEDLAHGNKIILVEKNKVAKSQWPMTQSSIWTRGSKVDVWKHDTFLTHFQGKHEWKTFPKHSSSIHSKNRVNTYAHGNKTSYLENKQFPWGLPDAPPMNPVIYSHDSCMIFQWLLHNFHVTSTLFLLPYLQPSIFKTCVINCIFSIFQHWCIGLYANPSWQQWPHSASKNSVGVNLKQLRVMLTMT